MDYINIGSSPNGEKCVQVGDDDYETKSRKECRIYLNQLRRVYGEEPKGAQLTVKSFPHDFGSYTEVICKHNDDEKAIEYAYNLENGCEEWDEQAKKELKEAGLL